MTTDDWSTLVGFLCGGLLFGMVGHWLDLVTTYIRGR